MTIPPTAEPATSAPSIKILKPFSRRGASGEIASGTALGFVDRGVLRSSPYCYALTAINEMGESPVSADSSAVRSRECAVPVLTE